MVRVRGKDTIPVGVGETMLGEGIDSLDGEKGMEEEQEREKEDNCGDTAGGKLDSFLWEFDTREAENHFG